MGSKVWGGITLEKGVEVRSNPGGAETVSIRFWYHKIQCRELKLKATADNVRYANRLIGTVKDEIERNLFVYSKHFPESKRCKMFGGAITHLTVGAALDKRDSRDKSVNEDSTYRNDKRIVENHIKPEWGKTPMRDVNLAGITDWCEKLFATGVLVKTVSNILGPMRRIFNTAVMNGELKDNPFNNLILKSLRPKTAVSTYERRPFNAAERAALLKAATGRLDQMANLLQVWWWSGLSASEIVALKWSRIDFVNGLILVRAANVMGDRGDRTKNEGRKRDVTMLKLARKALLAQKAHTFVEAGDGFVFHNPATRKPWSSSKPLSKEGGVFQNLCKKAGVAYRGPNQCRHTYASMMIAGVPGQVRPGNLWKIAEQMGHFKRGSKEPNIEMLMKHYGAIIREIQQGDAAVVADQDWSQVEV